MGEPTISRTTLVAILVSMTAAMVARAWLQVRLIDGGMTAQTAADLSYLVVPFILVILLFPLWRGEREFLSDQLRRYDLSPGILLRALAIGVLLRLLWWSQLVFGISFGFYSSAEPDAIAGPVFSLQCGNSGSVILGIVVMAILIPLIEEIIHRGYVQTAVSHYGAVVAILVSALLFAVFHQSSSMPFVFLAGVVFGVQYWRSQSLWSSLVTHATVNSLILIDWRCLSGQWNPHFDDIPMVKPGIVAAGFAMACIGFLFVLLRGITTEASPPR